MKLFTGPGRYLVFSLGRVIDPSCTYEEYEEWAEDGWHRAGARGKCTCLYTQFQVPWGYWYSHDEYMHPEIVGKMTNAEYEQFKKDNPV